MSKYIVLPISISLKNNKFAEFGSLVDESQLNSPTHELLSGKFIRLATAEEIEALSQVASEDIQEEEEEKVDDSGIGKEDVDPVDESKQISKKDIVKNALTKK